MPRRATHRCCACGELVRLRPDLQNLPEVPGTCLCGQESLFSKLEFHLPIWTVYDHPLDAPGCFVARLHLAVRGRTFVTAKAVTAPTLEEIRRLLPPGLTLTPRAEKDDPCIVESWL